MKDVVSVEPEAIKPAIKLDPRWSRIVNQIIEVDGKIIMELAPDLLLVPRQALAA